MRFHRILQGAVSGATGVSGNNPIALLDRAPDAILFRRASGNIDARRFLHDVHVCAAALPDTGHVANLCTDRYWFAVGFAACVLRGRISLLTGDHSAVGLAALSACFGGAWGITDFTGAGKPGLPCQVIGPHLPLVAGTAGIPLIEAQQVAAIVFSSGSTGEPVGTAKNFGELAWRSRAAAERFGFDKSSLPATMVGTVPPHHMYGFETTVLLPLHASVSSWCDPVFYPGDLRTALSAGGRQVLVTTPLHLRAMLAMTGAARRPDVVISATAWLDAGLAEQVEQAWECEVLEIFGASEVGSVASRRTVSGDGWTLYPGVTLDTAGARPMIAAAGAAARPLSDQVELIAGGRDFRLLGRCGDMVKMGGRRASLAQLSRTLAGIDGVSEGVFLAPDDIETRPTARLMALVVAPDLAPEALLRALRPQIDPVFMPRPLIRVPSLPHDALGKLPRAALLALMAEHAPGSRPRAAA